MCSSSSALLVPVLSGSWKSSLTQAACSGVHLDYCLFKANCPPHHGLEAITYPNVLILMANLYLLPSVVNSDCSKLCSWRCPQQRPNSTCYPGERWGLCLSIFHLSELVTMLMWFPRLGHKRQCNFHLALLGHLLLETSCHVGEEAKLAHGKTEHKRSHGTVMTDSPAEVPASIRRQAYEWRYSR